MKKIKIFLIILTLLLYICSIVTFLVSMVNNDTYLIGLVIVTLILADKMEKRIVGVEK